MLCDCQHFFRVFSFLLSFSLASLLPGSAVLSLEPEQFPASEVKLEEQSKVFFLKAERSVLKSSIAFTLKAQAHTLSRCLESKLPKTPKTLESFKSSTHLFHLNIYRNIYPYKLRLGAYICI